MNTQHHMPIFGVLMTLAIAPNAHTLDVVMERVLKGDYSEEEYRQAAEACAARKRLMGW
jgi:hypothetical protein